MTQSTERNDAMHVAGSRSEQALDRLLALRPEDLDGWEIEAAAELPDDQRVEQEALDAAFAGLLDDWKSMGDDAVSEPSIRAADFVGLPRDGEADGPGVPPSRNLRRGLGAPSWLIPAALAACLALLAFGTWQIRDFDAPALPGDDGIKAVTPELTTRVELSFSVERSLPTGVVVEPGRREAVYGPDDRLALQVAVQGEGGWLYLFESGEVLQPIWTAQVTAGVHALTSPAGDPLVWQPDALAGRTTYVALVSGQELGAEMAATIAGDVLSAADRPDVWPRPVLSVDSFTVDWEDTSSR